MSGVIIRHIALEVVVRGSNGQRIGKLNVGMDMESDRFLLKPIAA